MTPTKKQRTRTTSARSHSVTELKQQVDVLTAKVEEYMSGWQRAKADYDNLQRRTEQQRGELVKTATADLVQALLPVIDNLERALEHATDLKSVQQGVEMIARQLHDILGGQGVEVVRAKGKTFDPALHEAVAHIAGDKDMCVIEHAPGYKLHGKLLRPSRVSVGNGQAS